MAKKVVNEKSKKTEEKQNKFIIFLIFVIIVLLVAIVIVKIARRDNLDTDNELVTELQNYFNTTDLSDCAGLINYSDSLVEYDDISSEDKLCLAYQKATIPEDSETVSYDVDKNKTICTTDDDMVFRAEDDADTCEVTIIDKEVIDNSYLKIFGTEIEENESFMVDNYNICYLKDDKYYCGLSETFTYTLGNEATIYRIIDKAVEKGDTIEIYDYFIKLNSDTCYMYYTPSTINQDCTDAYDSDSTTVNYKFIEKYGTAYKHIFKKAADGTYYWVSSEPTSTTTENEVTDE